MDTRLSNLCVAFTMETTVLLKLETSSFILRLLSDTSRLVTFKIEMLIFS